MNQHDDYFFSKRSSLRLLNPLCKSTTPNSKAHSSKTTRIFIVSLAKIPKYQVLSPISCSLESKPENIKSWILSKLCIVNHCDILKGRPRLETTRAALWLFYSIFYCLFPLLWSCCHLWKSVNHDVPRQCSTERRWTFLDAWWWYIKRYDRTR